MAKRPSFQFYPSDWKTNANLRRCSEAARGAWMDILCVLHDGDEYGLVRWPLEDLARSASVAIKLARELAAKSVLKGSDAKHSAYIFTPRHAGKDGEPVTLIEAGDGPCWYSSRMVRDEYIRSRRGASTQFTSENQPKSEPETAPKPPFGYDKGDGPSTSSSSSISEAKASSIELPDWLPREPWLAFLESRRRQKIPNTQRSLTLVLNKLEEFRGKGHDPGELLDRAVERGWRSVFEPNERIGNGQADRKSTAHDRFLAGALAVISGGADAGTEPGLAGGGDDDAGAAGYPLLPARLHGGTG